MRYRTDLAVENQEMLDEARKKAGRTGRDTDEVGGDSGYTIRKKIHDEDIKITEIVIMGRRVRKLLASPKEGMLPSKYRVSWNRKKA